MAKYLEKLSTARLIIKQNGGLVGSFLTLFRTDELKDGSLIGVDKYGNKYYENSRYFIGRNRWVIYSDSVGWDYDGSQVPADWHRWLHQMTDQPPSTHPQPQRKWMIDHKENLSGTNDQYVPYSTTRPKLQSWVPPNN